MDGHQYVYFQCCPYLCHKIFPLFDQPSLKGRFNLRVVSPPGWEVLSNTPLVKEENLGEAKISTFETTPPLSSYLFAVIAGPYVAIKCEKTHRDIPMRIFSRKSNFKYMERLSEFIFEVTNKSMEFYETYFGYLFPFKKYDQIFCAEFKWGAMENAVIFEGYRTSGRWRASSRGRSEFFLSGRKGFFFFLINFFFFFQPLIL